MRIFAVFLSTRPDLETAVFDQRSQKAYERYLKQRRIRLRSKNVCVGLARQTRKNCFAICGIADQGNATWRDKSMELVTA